MVLVDTSDLIQRVPAVDHPEVATFVRSRKLHGRGIGWIDAHLLASALVADTWLWTADEHLARVAGELGIGYESRHA
jgi:predicted nucleic acid-binding protein